MQVITRSYIIVRYGGSSVKFGKIIFVDMRKSQPLPPHHHPQNKNKNKKAVNCVNS